MTSRQRARRARQLPDAARVPPDSGGPPPDPRARVRPRGADHRR
jgi:hypothetical protein